MTAAPSGAKVCNIVGGALSPLLSNILLDELDKELERRGHRFVRYADDCERAWISANNARGPWWNAGASHMNQAVPTRYLSQLGLPSLIQRLQRPG